MKEAREVSYLPWKINDKTAKIKKDVNTRNPYHKDEIDASPRLPKIRR